MRRTFSWLTPLLLAACGAAGSNGNPDSGAFDGAAASAGASPLDAWLAPADGGPFHGGNPNGSCSAGVPAAGKPVDTSKPTTVVGTGTAASCTFAALSSAVAKGGIITFDCGGGPVTIAVTATLDLPTNVDTVLDGGGLITLDGQAAARILSFNSPGYRTNTTRVTIQRLAFVRAKTNPVQAIPFAAAPCSQGFNDGEGGAIYMRDGNL